MAYMALRYAGEIWCWPQAFFLNDGRAPLSLSSTWYIHYAERLCAVSNQRWHVGTVQLNLTNPCLRMVFLFYGNYDIFFPLVTVFRRRIPK